MLRRPLLLAILAASGTAAANPASIVPGGQDPDDPDAVHAQKSVDIYASIDYSYELSSSTIGRERNRTTTDPTQPLPIVRDLAFKSFRHVLTPRLDIGVFRDSFVYAALPIVITQARELRLDDGVSRDGSSTVTDGLLTSAGFDARDPGTATTGDLMFRGPSRHGLDKVLLGLGVALMNQASDPTKPTWKLGAELRLSVGTIAKFDRMQPDANHGVSDGVQELKLWTTWGRRLGWGEPWVEAWWLTPLAARSGSLYTDPGFGATNVEKGQQAGVGFGLEVYAVEKPADKTRISLDVGTHITAHFEGREYTEMWEVFAYAGDSRTGGPLILDADPTKSGVQPLSHPGISNIENYLETSGQFAIRAQIGPHVRFAVLTNLIWKTDHAITFADAGVDRGDSNDLVNPGTDEVNPLHSQPIDLVGHRYLSLDNFDFALGVEGQVNF